MSNISDITYYNDLFDKYTGKFLIEGDNKLNNNIRLKIVHSKNVQFNCAGIADSESLNSGNKFIAELCGLFHDIGRFEQYTKYNTFRDDDSVYHGELGVEVMKKEGFLSGLDYNIINIILESIYNHGLLKIPDSAKGDVLFFSKLVRDADKIDIYRIVSEYYHISGPRNVALEYNLETKPYISESVMDDFKNKELISKAKLKSLNDFKTMQLSWIFDLNFNYTKKVIGENGYINSILSSITDIDKKKYLEGIINSVMS